jgi:hypothetical protein
VNRQRFAGFLRWGLEQTRDENTKTYGKIGEGAITRGRNAYNRIKSRKKTLDKRISSWYNENVKISERKGDYPKW